MFEIHKLDNENPLFSKDEVLSFLINNDRLFSPKISERVDLIEFVNRIYSRANILVISVNSDLIALATFYTNLPKAYLSLLVVDKKYQGCGIAKKIINEILNDCLTKNIKQIGIHTELTNIKALSVYKTFGFVIVEEFDKRVYLEKEL